MTFHPSDDRQHGHAIRRRQGGRSSVYGGGSSYCSDPNCSDYATGQGPHPDVCDAHHISRFLDLYADDPGEAPEREEEAYLDAAHREEVRRGDYFPPS